MAVPVRVFVDPLSSCTWEEGERQDAFAEMYTRFRPDLVALCRRLLHNGHDAEGVAQEAFVKAWASIDRFTGARPFWPWVATIARRLCIDELRKGGREFRGREYLRSVHGAEVGVQPDDLVVQRDDEHAALKALRALAPRDQRLITLRDLNEWSYEEIAGFEGVTVESVRGLLKRARASLRRAYQGSAGALGALAPVAAYRRMRHRLGAAVSNRFGVGTGRPFLGNGIAEALMTTLTLAIVTSSGAAGVTAGPPAVEGASGATDTASASSPGATQADDTVVARIDGGAASLRPQARPAATSTGGAAGVAGDEPSGILPLPSDGATRPEHVQFDQITASDDGTLFATGSPRTACPTVSCAALFQSTDAGETWKRLPATGFVGGELLVAPDFAEDRRLFAASNLGLHQSTDGGRNFELVAPLGGPAAMSPTFSAGDPTILIGGAPRWAYDAASRVATPSTLLLPSTSAVTSFAFSPAYATDRLLFAGTTAADGSAGVHRCQGTMCNERAPLASLTAIPNIVVSPAFADDHEVWAWRGKLLYRSGDGGLSFERVALPAGTDLSSVLVGADGTYITSWADHTGRGGGLFRTTDHGRTWQEVAATGRFAAGVTAIADVGGRLIAAVDAALGQASLLWSDDRGATWRTAS